MLGWLHRAGVDIRPEAMGIDWEAAATAMRRLAWYVRHADLPYTIADVRPVTDEIVDQHPRPDHAQRSGRGPRRGRPR